MATGDTKLYQEAMKHPATMNDIEDRRHENDGSPKDFIDVNKPSAPDITPADDFDPSKRPHLPAHAHKKASYKLTQE